MSLVTLEIVSSDGMYTLRISKHQDCALINIRRLHSHAHVPIGREEIDSVIDALEFIKDAIDDEHEEIEDATHSSDGVLYPAPFENEIFKI